MSGGDFDQPKSGFRKMKIPQPEYCPSQIQPRGFPKPTGIFGPAPKNLDDKATLRSEIQMIKDKL